MIELAKCGSKMAVVGDVKTRRIVNNGEPAWLVDLGKKDVGRRLRIVRRSKSEAIAAARKEIDRYAMHGKAGDFITTEERAFILRWRGMFGTWSAVSQILESHQTITSLTVEDAVSRYQSAPRARPWKARTKKDVASRLGAFAEAFKGRHLETIRPGELESYCVSKGGAAPNHYRNISALLNHAARHDWIPRNPLEKVERPAAMNQEKDVMTPEQMIAALKFAASEGYALLLRTLVFGGFVGLRFSEIVALSCSDVDPLLGEVFVRDMKTESRGISSRHVPLEPNALAWVRWLDLPPSGPVFNGSDMTHRRQRRKLAEHLGIKWGHNIMRRSHGSYHLAAFESASLTAERMGHTDAKTTKAKYRVVRRKDVALAWFAITPESLRTQPTET